MGLDSWKCEECADVGRRGTCAPLRCYCGHRACHAFASYAPRVEVVAPTQAPQKRRNAWAERTEPTWIDNL